VLALHNAEEALTADRYIPLVREYISHVPLLRTVGVVPPSLPRLYAALLVATLVPALVIGWATTGRDSTVKRDVVAIVAAAVSWNVFLPHLAAMIVLRGYAPGGITALAVNLPFCVYFFRRSWRDGMLTRRRIALALVLGLLLLTAAPLLLLV
jgi:hypothetical protein